MNAEEKIASLIDTMDSNDFQQKNEAEKEARELGVSALIPLLQNRRTAIVYFAARALGQLGDTSALLPLSALLHHCHSHLRREAAEAMVNIGEESLPFFLELLKSEEEGERELASEALVELGDPKSSSALIAALKDESVSVVASATLALGRIREPLAVCPLVELLLETEEDLLEEEAKDALTKIGKPAVPMLLKIVDENPFDEAQKAAEVLRRMQVPVLPSFLLEKMAGEGFVGETYFLQLLMEVPEFSVSDLRLLGKKIRMMKALCERSKEEGNIQEEMDLGNKLGELQFLYSTWILKLKHDSKVGHGSLQAPPKSFRKPPRRFGRRNAAAERKMAIESGRNIRIGGVRK
jgi:HEAT repeat protein